MNATVTPVNATVTPLKAPPGAGLLHLVVFRPPVEDAAPVCPLMQALDELEAARAATFVHDRDRRQYVAAHATLRRVLAEYTGHEPSRVPLGRAEGPYGKPQLIGSPVPLHFNLSHSHGLIAIGVAADPVGVDVQRVPSPEAVEVVLPRLHPREREELRALPASERPEAFARLWTRKEAYLKGLGTGLTRSPAADYLGETAAARPAGWTVRNVPVQPGYAAAAALRHHPT
uniref:JadM phosphopantetheinyl transferase-like protein n=1 Tax=Streptomyces murayamaensis TaxID=224537 RepID=Q84CI8_9ACTN|nr:JadM phosphopantetheinyl transferase-like protein [Streptomyces murayamaensis]